MRGIFYINTVKINEVSEEFNPMKSDIMESIQRLESIKADLSGGPYGEVSSVIGGVIQDLYGKSKSLDQMQKVLRFSANAYKKEDNKLIGFQSMLNDRYGKSTNIGAGIEIGIGADIGAAIGGVIAGIGAGIKIGNDSSKNWEKVLSNLAEDTTLGLSNDMKKTMVGIGCTMLNEGYELSFVAGMLANIMHEGKASGYFESSAYISNPSAQPGYLKYMDENYNYRAEYSGQSIEGKSLSAISAILEELESKKLQNGKWPGGFGLGSVQWTFERTKTLLETYMEVAGTSDTITFEQMVEAEGLMISRELKGNYNYIYSEWEEGNSNQIDSSQAAYNAAVDLCKNYERPLDDSSLDRGETAKIIYEIIGQ